MTRIKDENYITIFGWMRTKLNLSGVTLLTYAVVYAFSQDGVSEYAGTIDWLSEFIGAGERSVYRALRELEKDGLIERYNRNLEKGMTNTYRTVGSRVFSVDEGGCQNGNPPQEEGAAKMATPSAKMATPSAKMAADNKYNNKNNNSCKESKKENKQESTARVDFSAMTDEDLIRWHEEVVPALEPTAETFELIDACNLELKKRRHNFRGKVRINEEGEPEWLKSYDEIMTEYSLSKPLRDKLWSFIRHCQLNGRKVINSKLDDICFRLTDEYSDDRERIKALDRAISGGYFDIKTFGGVS